MKLLEEYKELVERDADEMSCLWKYVQMFLYLVCAISGYICSVLFYVLQEQIFGGTCPLWATCILISSEDFGWTVAPDAGPRFSDWWRYIDTDSNSEITCTMYLTTCFLSCMFGVVWFTLFFMCGRGGYDVASAYENSSAIVFPAIVFTFLFSVVSVFAHYDLEGGYEAFKSSVNDISAEVRSPREMAANVPSDCEIIKTYMKMNSFPRYYMCDIMAYLQVFSAVMMCSWIAGWIVLLLRVTMIDDFRILRVQIYEAKDE